MNAKKRTTILLGTVAALIVALAVAVPTLAQKVDNPGGVQLSATGGNLQINDQSFSFGASSVSFKGTVSPDGKLTIPKQNVVFPDQQVSGAGYTFNVHISANNNATGSIDPLTGATTLTASLRVDVDAAGSKPPGFDNDCHVSPINFTLKSTNPGGKAYDPATGKVTVTGSGFHVPGADSCGSAIIIDYDDELNSQLGIPTNNTSASIGAKVSPILRKAIDASLDASPTSGLAPLDVTLDASDSHVKATPAKYRWDFDGNGSVDATTDTATTHHSYGAGTFHPKVTVVDRDGDSDAATGPTVKATARTPDVTIDKSHEGDFTASAPGTYSLAVGNVGTKATTGTTTVTDELPDSLTYTAASGDGWDCSAAGQNVTCTHAGAIAAGASAAPIALTVGVTGAAVPSVTNTASVSTPGDVNHGNDSDDDTANVTRPASDLAIDATHDGDYFLRAGAQNPRGTYHLQVTNVGAQPTSGTITVKDTVPAGLAPHAAFGLGWNCGIAGQDITCTTDTVVQGGADAEPINLIVDVAQDAPDSIQNTATVSTVGDENPANDSDTDTVATRPYGVDLKIDKSHQGTFVRGETERYRIVVSNHGTAGSSGPIVVTDELPAGLSYVSAVGASWSCGADGQTVTCTRADSLQPGRTAAGITLRVKVGASAAEDGVTNVASVSGPSEDLDPSDNQDADPTNIHRLTPDLAIDKSHSGTFTAGQPGVYTLAVKNVGEDATFDKVTVTDVLPDGLVYDAANGDGWLCGDAAQTVTCTTTDPIAAGASAPPIAVRVVPKSGALGGVTNTATVQTANDPNAGNDSDSDPTDVQNPPATTGAVKHVSGAAYYKDGDAYFGIDVTQDCFLFLCHYKGGVYVYEPGVGEKEFGSLNAFTPVTRYGVNGAEGDATMANGQKLHWKVDDLSAKNIGADTISVSSPNGYSFSGPISSGDITVE